MKRKILILKYWLMSSAFIYLSWSFIKFEILSPLDIYYQLKCLNQWSRATILLSYIGFYFIYYSILDAEFLPKKEKQQNKTE